MKNELQYKLSNYEAQPPDGVWDEISEALDHQTAPHAKVLYQFQQAPPPGIWNKIEDALSEKESGKAILLGQRRPLFVRYAAAAVILVLLATGITLWMTKERTGEIARSSDPVHTTPTVKEPGQNNTQPDPQVNSSTTNTPEKKETPASYPLAKGNTRGTDRYLTRADEDGKKIRVSKKAASVFKCADNIASVNSIRCKENIELLQQKISASLISPSADFSGLMDMIKTLEENK